MRTIELEEARRLVAEGGNLPRARRMELQQERLHELVAYVRSHSPYFARHYADVPADFSLASLPPTDKPTLLANYDDWVTDRRIHLDDVLDYVRRDASKDQSRFLGDYTALRTSGSTGNPLPMVRDDYHNKIHGQLIAQRLLAGANADAMDISKHRRASVIHLSNGASSYGAFLRMKAAHPDFADNLLGISVLEPIDVIVGKLNAFQPETMAGYPSRAAKGDPVSLAYEIHNHGAGRCSWDHTAMLEAVRPGVYWNYHAFGRITVDEAMVTHWSPDAGARHSYLLPKADYEEIRQVIDDLVDGK